MRRMLSGFLAASMVASVCATASFAAVVKSTPTEFTIDLSGVSDAAVDTTNAQIDFTLVTGGSITLKAGKIAQGSKPDQIADAFYDAQDITVNGKAMYATSGRPIQPEDFNLTRQGDKLYLTTKITGEDVEICNVGTTQTLTGDDGKSTPTNAFTTPTITVSRTQVGANGEGSDEATITELKNLDIRDIVVCDEDGNPIPLTENADGPKKDQNNDDGVQSGGTVYFKIRNDTGLRFEDDTYWKLRLSKGDNSKHVTELSDVTKNFGTDLYNIYTHTIQPDSGNGRSRYIKVKVNEIYTDDEVKITLDLRLTPKAKAVEAFPKQVDEDTEVKVKDFAFYMKNIVRTADSEWEVGIGGLMLNPVKNDWNEVTYVDEDGDVAFMKFFGDSDTGKFYAKLSTKWEHADYASYFNDQDAYIFQFTGSPSLSSTSRADLEIYSPFVDEDGNETFDPEQAIIYQVVDGDLFDITDSFEYREGENGDMAYCTRTRFLGTYIICQKPVDEASNDDVVDLVPDDNLTPDNNAGAPVEVNPGNNGGSGSKAPANTGKF